MAGKSEPRAQLELTLTRKHCSLQCFYRHTSQDDQEGPKSSTPNFAHVARLVKLGSVWRWFTCFRKHRRKRARNSAFAVQKHCLDNISNCLLKALSGAFTGLSPHTTLLLLGVERPDRTG